MGTPETSREPCPDRILDDLGGAFAMGAVGGSVFHFAKGVYATPRGEKLLGGLNTMRMNAPRTGGGFAVWGGLFSTFDCGMVYVRQKEDPWNSIFAGAATGGFLQMRQGLRASAKSAAFGGVLLALIEGAGIMVNKYMSPPPMVLYDDPSMMGAGAGGSGGVGPGVGTGEEKGWFDGMFGGLMSKKKEEEKKDGREKREDVDGKVLESFDSPTPMPSFEFK